MQNYNTYKTTGTGFYSNSQETIFINQHGKAFIIQSPDMNDCDEAIPTDNFLPCDMVQLGNSDCVCLSVPEWVYDEK